MTIVTANEFNSNSQKYFSMAVNSEICIKDDNYMFHLTGNPIDEQMILQPDDDLRRAITLDELFDGARNHIKTIFTKNLIII